MDFEKICTWFDRVAGARLVRRTEPRRGSVRGCAAARRCSRSFEAKVFEVNATNDTAENARLADPPPAHGGIWRLRRP